MTSKACAFVAQALLTAGANWQPVRIGGCPFTALEAPKGFARGNAAQAL